MQKVEGQVKLVVKFSMEGDRRYVTGELVQECLDTTIALDSFDMIREWYQAEVGPSPLETFFRGMTLEQVVDVLTEETAAAMPFPLPKVKDQSYEGKTVGEVFMTEDGLVDWVNRKISFDEEDSIIRKLGIAACVWYFTDQEGAY